MALRGGYLRQPRRDDSRGPAQRPRDGMSEEEDQTPSSEAMRQRSATQVFSPARRGCFIPEKRTGKLPGPLGLPSWSDKLVGEVVRLLPCWKSYYEPTFSGPLTRTDSGPGPRALPHPRCWEKYGENSGPGPCGGSSKENISDCFGSLDHEIMGPDPVGRKSTTTGFSPAEIRKHARRPGTLEKTGNITRTTERPHRQGGVVSAHTLQHFISASWDNYMPRTVSDPAQYSRGKPPGNNNPEYEKGRGTG